MMIDTFDNTKYSEYNYDVMLRYLVKNYAPKTSREAYSLYLKVKDNPDYGVYGDADTALGLVFDALRMVKSGQ